MWIYHSTWRNLSKLKQQEGNGLASRLFKLALNCAVWKVQENKQNYNWMIHISFWSKLIMLIYWDKHNLDCHKEQCGTYYMTETWAGKKRQRKLRKCLYLVTRNQNKVIIWRQSIDRSINKSINPSIFGKTVTNHEEHWTWGMLAEVSSESIFLCPIEKPKYYT
jgi:hypothetical protein